MRANFPRSCLRILLAILFAAAAAPHARAQSSADRLQQVEMAFDQYAAARTQDQRVAVIDYLQHFDRNLVAAALVDHIIASRTATEATSYNQLLEALNQEGCAAVVDRLATSTGPISKGKLIVALRHCTGPESIHAIASCLDDKRPFLFASRGPHPRRVCDVAYDELFLKLRPDPGYGLDPSPRMIGLITDKTPTKSRDALIAKLKQKLAAVPSASPSPSPSPSPSASPSPSPPGKAA